MSLDTSRNNAHRHSRPFPVLPELFDFFLAGLRSIEGAPEVSSPVGGSCAESCASLNDSDDSPMALGCWSLTTPVTSRAGVSMRADVAIGLKRTETGG